MHVPVIWPVSAAVAKVPGHKTTSNFVLAVEILYITQTDLLAVQYCDLISTVWNFQLRWFVL